MKLQKGKFLINNIHDLDESMSKEEQLKNIIYLEYMGQFEYEGNAIPISRMFIEYYMEEYSFYPTQIFNKNNQEMYIFANRSIINDKLKENKSYISDLVKHNIDRNLSLWDYINHDPETCLYDFWWNIKGDYLIFFGEEKIDVINYFIKTCLNRDGGKEEIKKKLLKVGYKL